VKVYNRKATPTGNHDYLDFSGSSHLKELREKEGLGAKEKPSDERDHAECNGEHDALAVDPETPLLFVLNDELGFRGPRFGCGMAQCGACTFIMRGPGGGGVMPVSAVGQDEVTAEWSATLTLGLL
jgi:hypothetical protein